ncbi:MAG TPA: hypothetical protein VLH13_01980 [Methanomassiliicoccales archaeon]|nr:hypothetical protein [Methanomassiliicoccales archaeon]
MVTYSWYEDTERVGGWDGALAETFQRIGGQHGYGKVNASFQPFKEFKASWTRRDTDIEFQVTDYMRPARQELMDEFAECLFQRVRSKRQGLRYPDQVKRWLESDDFVARNRPLYLKRSRNLSMGGKGAVYDLERSYDRLRATGMVPEIRNRYLTWTKNANIQRMGYCSVLMRTVAVSSALDDPEVPEFVTDYVLYHELLHMVKGLEQKRVHHDAEFKERERRFPLWREAETHLKRIAARK